MTFKRIIFAYHYNYISMTQYLTLMQDILDTSRLVTEGYFQHRSVISFWDEHISGRADHSHRLWTLLMLELWYRCFVDREDIGNLVALKQTKHT